MKHDLDRFIEEVKVCSKQVRDDLDIAISGALIRGYPGKLMGLSLAAAWSPSTIARLVVGIKQLDKIPYLTDLMYNHHNMRSDAKAPVSIGAEVDEIIISKIKPSQREAIQLGFRKIAALENEVRGIYKEKAQDLRATGVPNDDELPTRNEVEMLIATLRIMIPHATGAVFTSSNKVVTLVAAFERMNSPDIAPELRDDIFYKYKRFKDIDLERNLLTAVHELWTAVTETELKNTDRDTVHARAIVERLAKIQYLILKKLQVILNEIHTEQTAEFEAIGLNGLQKELISLREEFKTYTPETDHVSLFAHQSEMPFHRGINESILLLIRLIRLKDPDLVTENDKSVAQEQFKELLEDPKVLKKLREGIESILPKIKKEHQLEAESKMHRIVYIVQYAAIEMKKYLKESAQEMALQGMSESSHLALTGASEASQLALKP